MNLNSVRRINPLHRCLPRTRASFLAWTCWCDSDSLAAASCGCRWGSPKCPSLVRISYRPYLQAAASHLVWSYSECCPWGSLRKKENTSICQMLNYVNQVFYNHDNPWFIIFITISCLSHSTAQWIKHQTITYMYSIEPSYILWSYQTDQSKICSLLGIFKNTKQWAWRRAVIFII